MNIKNVDFLSPKFQIGDLLKMTEAYGGGSRIFKVMEIAPCSKWPVSPPYYHDCNGKEAVVVFDGEKTIISHIDMFELF